MFGGPKFRTIDDIDSSVQMKLYSMTKRELFTVFVCFFFAVSVTIIIGINGPSVVYSEAVKSSELPNGPKGSSQLQKGPFFLDSPYLSSFNQQLYLWCQIHTNNTGPGKYTEPFKMGVKILGKEDSYGFQVNRDSVERSRVLHCEGNTCKDFLVMHLGHLKYFLYTVTIEFSGLNGLPHPISEVLFIWQTFNPNFTQLEIWFRFGFLVVTFAAICLFAHSMRKFSIKDWTIEQKWLVILLPLLLLYNNPLFALTFLVGSWVPNLMDALFQTSFCGALLLFWVCTYHGLRSSERSICLFYVPKIILVGAVWMLALFFASWEGYHKTTEPTYSTDYDFKSFNALRVIFFVALGVYVLYLLFLIIRACTELTSLPYFDVRLKFLTLLTCVVIIACCTLLFIRYGVRMSDSETFAGSIRSRYSNSAEFLSLYSILNFYVYTLAYVYSPSKNAYTDGHFRDNPAFSMLNDESDDDVMYGGKTGNGLANGQRMGSKLMSDSD
ncbi:transmembrane protein 181-like isoform X2 [Convolutriloba macropyga]|uniref:transmembrane protein 181-like isoform X2 n=1 Tax=Convolutriloba macropyga TaxID=536237 RepID=UPI003F51BCCF